MAHFNQCSGKFWCKHLGALAELAVVRPNLPEILVKMCYFGFICFLKQKISWRDLLDLPRYRQKPSAEWIFMPLELKRVLEITSELTIKARSNTVRLYRSVKNF